MPIIIEVGVTVAVAIGLIGAFALAVRPSVIKGYAVAIGLGIVVIVGSNDVDRTVYVPAYALAALLLVIALIRGPRPTGRRNLVFWLMASWWALTAVVALLTESYSPTRMLVYFSTLLLFCYSASLLSRGELRIVARGILLLVAIEGAISAYDLVTGAAPLWWGVDSIARQNPFANDSIQRTMGTLGHPIVYGMLCGVGVVLAVSNTLAALTMRVRVAALLVALASLFLSGTRSALLAVAVACVVWVLGRFHLAAWVRNVVLVGMAAALVALLNLGIAGLIDGLVNSGSWFHRVTTIDAVPALLGRTGWSQWFGAGFGGEQSLFADGYIHLTYGLEVVDNYFVYLLGTTGIVGFVLFMVVCVVAFVRATREGRALIALGMTMFLAFDVTVWLSAGILLCLLLCLPGRSAALTESADAERVRRVLLEDRQFDEA
jgi:O-antigen ligase